MLFPSAKIASFLLLATALAAGFLAFPKSAAAGCCVVENQTTTDFCDATNPCPAAGTGGSASPATCDLAQTTCTPGTPSTNGNVPSGGAPSGGALTNPLEGVCKAGTTGQQCLQLVIGNVIKGALGIVGSLALLMVVWGGFLWLTSAGNSERVEKGKNVLIWSFLGLGLIFGAYAVVSYVIDKLLGN